MTKQPLQITSVEQTCYACPSQWDAMTPDGKPVYIRFRHGWLSVQIGPLHGDSWSAVESEDYWYDGSIADVYDGDGIISLEDACRFANMMEI